MDLPSLERSYTHRWKGKNDRRLGCPETCIPTDLCRMCKPLRRLRAIGSNVKDKPDLDLNYLFGWF